MTAPANGGGIEHSTPPNDIEAEQAMLGGMLLSKDAIAEVTTLVVSDDLYRPAHQMIFDVIVDLYSRSQPVDAITVNAELVKKDEISRVGGPVYLHTLLSVVPTAANAGYYARIVEERALQRRLFQASITGAQLALGAGDVSENYAMAVHNIEQVSERKVGTGYQTAEEILRPTLEKIEELGNTSGAITGIPTGFADLDDLLAGLHAGQMIVIAARPGIGKALALDTELPTPDGTTTMGAVRPGDLLIAADGSPTRVTAATPVMHDRPCSVVTVSDGTTLVADDDHQWTTVENGTVTTARAAALLHAGHALTLPDDLMPGRTAPPRTITAVTPTATVPVRCVEVDNPDRLYLAGPGRVPTHNSTLGLDLIRSCAIQHNLPAALFSLEMSDYEIMLRMLSAECRVPLHNLRTGQVSDEDWDRIAKRMPEIAAAPLYIDDDPNISMLDIRSKARQMKQRGGLSLIVIDYLQLMGGSAKVESRQQEVSQISRSMKLLAKELEVPVVVMSQLNRGSENRSDKTPQLSDLRECLTGDSLVPNPDGGPDRRLDDLHRADRPFRVWAMDEHLKVVPADALGTADAGVKKVYLLRAGDGHRIRASGQHPFRTRDGWTVLDDLVPGTEIAVMPGPGTPTGGVEWQPVHEITPDGEETTYDIVVPGRENFVANGIVVHNSGAIEQDADVVILLYREDAFDKESVRAGEADFIVAKHRNGQTRTVTVTSQLHYSRFADMASP